MKLKLFPVFLLTFSLQLLQAQKPGTDSQDQKLTPGLLHFLKTNTQQKGINTHKDLYKLVYNNRDELLKVLEQSGILDAITLQNPEYHSIVLKIKDTTFLHRIIQLPSVSYIDLYHPAKEELEVGIFDPSVNLINLLHQKYPLLRGEGFTLSIKENIFDTLDIDFKGRYIRSATQSTDFSPHASTMATLAAGAGNTSTLSLGVSPGANITSSSFTNLFPDPASGLQQLGVTVQNHSYGTAIENYYGAEARAYDQQLNAMPMLGHIFSAGNSGALAPTTGIYAGLTGVANLTGNFKMAKNVLTVAGSDSFLRVATAISKGPAYDGRVKPELTAFGEDGSSGAAALVSGTLTRLQHLFRSVYGSLPEMALLRAILFNSANDIGPPGIDFSSGFGSLNTVKAADNIANGRFFSGRVAQGETGVFNVSIPPGIEKARFTLAWNDPAASQLSPKALVNDLDIVLVRLSDNANFLPWVLNHFPHPDSLKQLPQRKRDTLNNAEQVTLDKPVAGIYEIRIQGFSIPQGPQSFHIAYQFDSTSHFQFTSPVNGDIFRPGVANTIRWENTYGGTGDLEYTLDNLNWQAIARGVDLGKGFWVWETPDTFSVARIRMTGPAQVLSDHFVISPQPELYIGFNCPVDFMLFWNQQKNAARYELFQLGPNSLESLGSQSDTFSIYKKTEHPSLHYAFRPILANGSAGQRSYAYNYTTQGVECFIRSFLAELIGEKADLMIELSSFTGISELAIEKQSGSGNTILWQQANPRQLNFTFADNSLITGQNTYRVRITRANGEVSYSDPATVYYFGKLLYLVYPNPVTRGGILQVVSLTQNSAILSLYDGWGRLVVQTKVNEFVKQIPMHGLQSGFYFFIIMEEGKRVQQGKILIH